MTTRHLLALALLPVMAVLAGCGKKQTPAKVSGTVTYNGQLVTGGLLTFYPVDSGGAYTAAITPEGKYEAVDLPAGEMIVTVDTEMLNPNIKKETYKGQTTGGGKAGPPGPGGASAPQGAKQKMSPAPEGANTGPQGTYVKIPEDYRDKTKSKARVTLTSGTQTKDIQLTD